MTRVQQGITQFYLPPTHEPYLPLLPNHKASPPLGQYHLILLGEQRHTGVRNLLSVSTLCARPRLELITSRSQATYSVNAKFLATLVFYRT